MTRAIGPRAGLPDQVLVPCVILALVWIPAGAAAALWLAGHLASALTGHGWAGPALSLHWGLRLVRRGPGASWPGVPIGLIWVLAAALVFGAAALVVAVVARYRGRQGAPGDPVGSLARAGDLARLSPAGSEASARHLRRSMADERRPDPDDTGLPLGSLFPSGPQLRASWEDVLVVFMAPRRGKTSEVAVPQVLAAPGAVLATSNKADLWSLTATLRAEATGEPVWVFDPQGIAHTERSWWWNPLSGVTTVEAAHRLAGHFVTEVRADREREFWSSAAEDILTSLFLAAGCGGRTLADVYTWLARPTTPVPVDLLRKAGHDASADGLEGKQHGAVETREGEWETARTAARCLRDPVIMSWVIPPESPAVPEFDAGRFATTRETLYLLSKEAAGGAAPLVAAFADRVFREAERVAERRGGRLDPPLVAVLDEAANICKIAELPRLYSHLGSRGIIPVTILQSWPQGEGVWGQQGMAALWGAATVKIVGSGLDDDRFLEQVSRLIGDHDVATRAVHHGTGSVGENVSLRRQRILPVEALRELPQGRAVLLASGCKPALLQLQPWYRGPRQAEIATASQAALAGLTERANARVPA